MEAIFVAAVVVLSSFAYQTANAATPVNHAPQAVKVAHAVQQHEHQAEVQRVVISAKRIKA